MATLNIPNVPDEILARLRVRAEAAGSSLENEAIRCIEASLGDDPAFEEATRFRDSIRHKVLATESEINAAKGEGRR